MYLAFGALVKESHRTSVAQKVVAGAQSVIGGDMTAIQADEGLCLPNQRLRAIRASSGARGKVGAAAFAAAWRRNCFKASNGIGVAK